MFFRKILSTMVVLSAVLTLSLYAYAEDLVSKSPEGARTYIISPADGETVASEFIVKFGLQGMGVAPAGVKKENTGHHHLIIDGEIPEMGKPMGSDVMHFGGGQTEKLIKLEKGKHTLQIILGNHFHIPHNPAIVSEKITIYVK